MYFFSLFFFFNFLLVGLLLYTLIAVVVDKLSLHLRLMKKVVPFCCCSFAAAWPAAHNQCWLLFNASNQIPACIPSIPIRAQSLQVVTTSHHQSLLVTSSHHQLLLVTSSHNQSPPVTSLKKSMRG